MSGASLWTSGFFEGLAVASFVAFMVKRSSARKHGATRDKCGRVIYPLCDLCGGRHPSVISCAPIPPEDLARASQFVRDQGWARDGEGGAS